MTFVIMHLIFTDFNIVIFMPSFSLKKCQLTKIEIKVLDHFQQPQLQLKYYSLSVLSEKLYFLETGPVNQKLWPFKCTMLKTLNSNFLD